MKNSFLTNNEIELIGFKKIGKECKISRNANFYGAENIILGDNVRIDDFSILSGKIRIGSYVHISAFSALYGSMGIQIGNFSGLSPRSIIFSATDNFSGDYFINATIPNEYTNVTGGKVAIGEYVQLGTNTIVMPNLLIGDGSITGAFSFVNRNLDSWGIYKGIPVKFYKKRNSNFIWNKDKFYKQD